MSTRPHLVRSVPFWGLVVVSLATAAGGAYLLSDRLGTMTTVLTAGTATPVDVYVGQSMAVAGAVVLGAGIIGLLLALAIAALSTLRPRAAAEPAEAADASDEPHMDADPTDHGYERGLGYTEAVPTVGRTADADEDAAVAAR
ncbi:dinucleotide-utilizing enzyme [Microbacterium sp. CFH 90308]|uniref:Dinucleotide-utilizing enzyme n=1 Tax=Microbacterium salsuginis TaxID=2722803 RepID=A0ABX1KG42_9MICO|nr:dinucleotide-utilizing enzyme [Microbacterium sp. CFH 90308]NLP86036.1 dinucleotide-utilizing enzyme [Microbacterium sp. CFH 90308]